MDPDTRYNEAIALIAEIMNEYKSSNAGGAGNAECKEMLKQMKKQYLAMVNAS